MLILSRRTNQSILLFPNHSSKDLTVEEFFSDRPLILNVHSVQGRQVKLAIGAPDNMIILRKELIHRLREEEGLEYKPISSTLPK